jgi:hypothetical protein
MSPVPKIWDTVIKPLAMQMQAQASQQNATGLNPVFKQMFDAYNSSVGNKFSITSGFRSYQQQAALYADYINGVPGQAPAAPPGRSNHEKGLAIDHAPHSTGADREIARTHGLHYPMGYEPWHVEPINKESVISQAAAAGIGSAVGGNAIKSLAMSMLQQRGWGGYWNVFDSLVTRESGWNPLAQNPTSTAFGLGQFLNSTWDDVGGVKTSDPHMQLEYLMRYIAQRYGNPEKAFDFWLRNHWYADGGINPPMQGIPQKTYDKGGVLSPGYTLAYNGTGKDEYVVKSGGPGDDGKDAYSPTFNINGSTDGKTRRYVKNEMKRRDREVARKIRKA